MQWGPVRMSVADSTHFFRRSGSSPSLIALPWCPEALKTQLIDKIQLYKAARWWEETNVSQAAPMLCIYKKDGVMDIGYFSYFLSLICQIRKLSAITYLNPCSEFILNFLDIIYSQMTPIRKQSFLLKLEPLLEPCLPTMPYSVITIVAMLTSKRLWLCMTKRAGVFNHLFLYRFLLKYCYKYIKSRYLVGCLPVKSTRKLPEN